MRTLKTRFVAASGLAIGLAAILCPSEARADTIDVNVFDSDFSINLPGAPIVWPTINLGDTIRWNFLNDHHTTTSVAGSLETWDSDMLMTGATFSHTFSNTGVFWYYCFVHGGDLGNGTAVGMAATITVVPSTGPLGVLAGAGLLAVRRRRYAHRGHHAIGVFGSAAVHALRLLIGGSNMA